MENSKDADLFSRTWKTVVVLVGACMLFVGALSGAAVLLTSHAFPDGHHGSTVSDGDEVKADAKPDAKAGPNAGASKSAVPTTPIVKKPVSI